MKPPKEGHQLAGAEELLDLAISAEMDAHQFYLRAADRVKDAKTRAAFLALAGDEEGHRLQLEGEYHHLYAKRGFQYRPGTNLLHRHLKRDLQDLEAIALGIQAEKEAIAFYRESERKVKRPELKKILCALAEFEEGHRRVLESEYQARLGRPWADSELDLWVRE
ncbi:MAG: ferritin family protein [candidate division NC10 bacterium]|nr:ferritin family protein [candidate division NC10 bacterium]